MCEQWVAHPSTHCDGKVTLQRQDVVKNAQLPRIWALRSINTFKVDKNRRVFPRVTNCRPHHKMLAACQLFRKCLLVQIHKSSTYIHHHQFSFFFFLIILGIDFFRQIFPLSRCPIHLKIQFELINTFLNTEYKSEHMLTRQTDVLHVTLQQDNLKLADAFLSLQALRIWPETRSVWGIRHVMRHPLCFTAELNPRETDTLVIRRSAVEPVPGEFMCSL